MSAPIGVAAALAARFDSSVTPRPQLWDQFKLTDRVGLVTGGNRGLGLEMALALLEAGARAVYCVDLPSEPGEEWKAVRDYVEAMGTGGRLEYVSQDVTKQEAMWAAAQSIGDKEGRMDVGIAAAGIVIAGKSGLDFTAHEFQSVLDVNASGVMFTAQAVGRQMDRFGTPGSIILISSIAGTVALDIKSLPYDTSKSAVLQMARSLACELGPKRIRVNTVSPGFVHTEMSRPTIQSDPATLVRWSAQNPLGRIATPDELRGVVAWLASDASSFCTGSNIFVDGGHHSW
ncbi:NAD(P)-binding protein [Artomyces pyxidatus]|uniref:NAD(P)-binding protein n=1 Tax=Artomyces pyxidatus TaxID=48021 RepID=A0ACB8T0I7_9AGAM|nr:NAD(P)-binding protein [Artomyces pyxidatus]